MAVKSFDVVSFNSFRPSSRYNGVGQLSCVICNLTIKTELLWTTHLQSKKHKEVGALFCCAMYPVYYTPLELQAVVNLKTQTSHKEAKSPTTKTTTPQSSDVPSKRRHIDEVCSFQEVLSHQMMDNFN